MSLIVSQCPVDARFHASSDAYAGAIRVKANLLDDGVADTLGSVGATSGVHTSVYINASDNARSPSPNPSPSTLPTSPLHISTNVGLNPSPRERVPILVSWRCSRLPKANP